MRGKVPSASAFAASVAAATLLLGAEGAQAGGGCYGSACYTLQQSPPVYGTINETYVARPAQTQSRIIPAEYEYVTEQVMVHPQRVIPRYRPAQYSTVAEQVLISPPSRRWEVSRDLYGNVTGCWVDVPARYGIQQRTVEISPASTDYETLPAVYGQRQRKVMVRQTQVVHETIPALYETRQRQVLMSPGSQYWARGRY